MENLNKHVNINRLNSSSRYTNGLNLGDECKRNPVPVFIPNYIWRCNRGVVIFPHTHIYIY